MSIINVVQYAAAWVGGTTLHSSITLNNRSQSPLAATAVNNFLILQVMSTGAVSSVSDSAGNTWTALDADQKIWICHSAASISALTINATGVALSVQFFELNNILPSSYLDPGIVETNGTAAFPTSGLTAASTNADDIVLGGIMSHSSSSYTLTPPASSTGWVTGGGVLQNSDNTRYWRGSFAHMVPGTTGTFSYTGTLTGAGAGSASWSAWAVALKPAGTSIITAGALSTEHTASLTGATAGDSNVLAGSAAGQSIAKTGSVTAGRQASATGALSFETSAAPNGTLLLGYGNMVAGAASLVSSGALNGSVETDIAIPGEAATADVSSLSGSIDGLINAEETFSYGFTAAGSTDPFSGLVDAEFNTVIPGDISSVANSPMAGSALSYTIVTGVESDETSTAPTGGVDPEVAENGPPAVSASVAPAGSVLYVENPVVSGPVAVSGSTAPLGYAIVSDEIPPFLVNLCSNPSFEVSLDGYATVGGVTLTQDFLHAVFGQTSMRVQTSGVTSGQGFIGTEAIFSDTSTACLSLYVRGESGTIQVSAVSNPGGVIKGTQVVQLTPQWQRVVIEGFTITSGASLYLLVQTPFAQDLDFNVDGVQYNEGSLTLEYIDGDQDHCVWLGVPGLSQSEEKNQYSFSLLSGIAVEGTLRVSHEGESFNATMSGDVVFDGHVSTSKASPVAAFDDFAMFELTDLDPAMTYASWNNATQKSGHSSYSRAEAIFHPPLDYPVSDGSYLWRRAQYMAVPFS